MYAHVYHACIAGAWAAAEAGATVMIFHLFIYLRRPRPCGCGAPCNYNVLRAGPVFRADASSSANVVFFFKVECHVQIASRLQRRAHQGHPSGILQQNRKIVLIFSSIILVILLQPTSWGNVPSHEAFYIYTVFWPMPGGAMSPDNKRYLYCACALRQTLLYFSSGALPSGNIQLKIKVKFISDAL